MEKKYTKEQILDAITQHWIEDFGCMQSEDDERDGYFVTGFVLSAIRKRLEPVVQVDTAVSLHHALNELLNLFIHAVGRDYNTVDDALKALAKSDPSLPISMSFNDEINELRDLSS